jgi:hypothetical protein
MKSTYSLPSKINSYLRRLVAEYNVSGEKKLAEIISSARVYIIEEASYDNWDGGVYGHDVKFFLPESILVKIKVREQNAVAEELLSDIRACAEGVEGEFFRKVLFELNDENDAEYQQASTFLLKPQIDPDSVSIWELGQIRLFISHKDIHKVAANELATALRGYGVSAFVAHDSIEPMSTWQQEIHRGLETMEIMLAFVTDDFHGSPWTNQEIGYALGRNIPVISLKLQNADPAGFIGNLQALKGRLDNPASSVKEIYKLLAEKLGNKHRLQTALVSAFLQSPDFTETKIRFDRLANVVTSLTEEDIAKITKGFFENSQLHQAIHLVSAYQRLKKFLDKTTTKEFVIEGKNIKEVKDSIIDDIPF